MKGWLCSKMEADDNKKYGLKRLPKAARSLKIKTSKMHDNYSCHFILLWKSFLIRKFPFPIQWFCDRFMAELEWVFKRMEEAKGGKLERKFRKKAESFGFFLLWCVAAFRRLTTMERPSFFPSSPNSTAQHKVYLLKEFSRFSLNFKKPLGIL